MHPAISLVLFTTWSGTGFGLIFWTGMGFGSQATGFAWTVLPVSAFLVAGGLIASVFHLKRPDRAWRSLSQWRSSWLSREAVLAIAASAMFGIYMLIWIFTGQRLFVPGLLASLLATVTVYATAMIYAQLRTVSAWASWLTPVAFMAFALAGGAMVMAALAAFFDDGPGVLPIIALASLALAWAVKLVWWRRAGQTGLASVGATREAATGLGGIGKVRPFEPPHTGGNYLLREMAFNVGRRRARALKRIALCLGALLPALLLLLSIVAWPALMLMAAVISFLIGIAAERWLFFAQAEHAVRAYYD